MNKFDEKLKKRLDNLLGNAKNAESAKNALALLFPKIENALETNISSDASDVKADRLSRRISQKDFAANYFTLSPATNAWGKTEFENLIKSGPESVFEQLNKRLEIAAVADRPDIRRLFIDLLDSVFSTQEHITKEWLDKILAESPTFLREKDRAPPSFFGAEIEDRLRWLILNALARLNEEGRATLLKETIASVDDLSVLADVVRSVVGDLNPDGAKGSREIANLGEQADAVRDILLERVQELARTNEIWRQADPGHLLWFWWGADRANEVKDFTNDAMDTVPGLKGLLNIPVSTVISSAGNYEHVNKSWPKIVDIAKLVERAQKLAGNSNDDELKRLANRFLAAVEKGRESPF